MFSIIERPENALRELVNARSLWAAYTAARAEVAKVRGSMSWKMQDGNEYLVSRGRAGEHLKSLGRRTPETEQMFAAFRSRKERAQARLEEMRRRIEEQRKLNRIYGVGRTPVVVVRALAALQDAGVADKFLVIGTHALYAYEMAAGVHVQSDALATRDLDLLFDMRKRVAFFTTLEQGHEQSLIRVLRKADPTFQVLENQKHTAVNDSGFEIDVVRRARSQDDPHPLRMSDDENDFWAVQISQGERIQSARHFEHLVVAPGGEMATMRTVHPLDFVRLKRDLSRSRARDPVKAPKDRLQADVVQQLWDEYLRHVERPADEPRTPTPPEGSW